MVSWTQVEFSTKSEKLTPNPEYLGSRINHRFPVSELLYELYAEAMLYELNHRFPVSELLYELYAEAMLYELNCRISVFSGF